MVRLMRTLDSRRCQDLDVIVAWLECPCLGVVPAENDKNVIAKNAGSSGITLVRLMQLEGCRSEIRSTIKRIS